MTNMIIETGAKKTDLWKVPPSLLVAEEDFNIRTDYGDIESLALSIIENGVKVPLSGYRKGEQFIITDGFRRNRAIKKAIELGHDIATVPFMVEPKGYNIEDRLFDMLLKNDGKNLSTFEMAELFKRLQNYGYSITQIAKKIGKTTGYVSELISVTNVPQLVKNEIAKGNISVSLVADIVKSTKTMENEVNHDKVTEIVKIAQEKKNGDNKKITKKDIIDVLPRTEKEQKTDKALSLVNVLKNVLQDNMFEEVSYSPIKETLEKINLFLEGNEITAEQLQQSILLALI